SVSSSVPASSSTRIGGSSVSPCDTIVRQRSTGSPPPPTSGNSALHGTRRTYTARVFRSNPLCLVNGAMTESGEGPQLPPSPDRPLSSWGEPLFPPASPFGGGVLAHATE